ncbi:Trehalase [Actinacidiphila rubida]|uniref:Trehalase n=3 Tax=Actinacidiphila rubida TaxID=310780 RepID=A0A1H8EBE9_9ACTN|nr:glycosyl hydrolase family 65 protein [Actinacidiphila rubida]SEN16795.1 Trehalase [Actinacidiphila rubida]
MTESTPSDADVPATGPRGVNRRRMLTAVAALGVTAGLSGPLSAGNAWAAPGTRPPAPGAGHQPPLDVAELARTHYGSDHAWFAENIPFIDIPDQVIADTYYYRWAAFTKHLRSTTSGRLITEFMPSVSWEGPNGTINAACGHHLREARWLRDRTYVEDYLNWWLGGGGNLHQYSSWIGDAVWADYEVSGDARVPLSHLDALKADLDAWDPQFDESKGLYWIVPVNDATEFTTTGLDVGDGWGGQAFRPTLNSYLFAQMRAIGRVAALAGDDATAADYTQRAARLATRVQDSLWNAEFQQFTDRFGPQYPDRYFDFASGPELAGYVPWSVGLPDARFDGSWRNLTDPGKFAGTHGLRTIYPTSPYYLVQHRTPGASPGECEWNGPSWPFQTSQVLTGLANLLDDRPQTAIGSADYVALLHQYAAQQRKDGRPYVAENLNPDTGQWIADFPDRSEHYNHSTFADLVISGLLGLRPSSGDTLRVRPLIPGDWDYFALQNVTYHGRRVSVVYDRDGTHYPLGRAGLSVWIDGELRVSGRSPDGTTVDLSRSPVARPVALANYAYNPVGQGFPLATASSTGDGTTAQGDDGRVWFDPAPVNRWVSVPDGRAAARYTVELAGDAVVSAARVHYYDDGSGVRAPIRHRLQYWKDGRWYDVRTLPGGDARPLPNTATGLLFPPVRAARFQLVMAPAKGTAVGIADLELLGARGQLPGVPEGAHRYEAEEAVVTGARIVLGGVAASGGGYVGGIDGSGSSVSFTAVHADRGATYRLGIRYANGLGPATHGVTVNAAGGYTASYPSTGGWGANGMWNVAFVDVPLVAGDNVVTLSKGTAFAELDCVFLAGEAPAR